MFSLAVPRWESYLDDRRVRLRKQRHRLCLKGGDLRTDQIEEGG